jgi:hypothetical protein
MTRALALALTAVAAAAPAPATARQVAGVEVAESVEVAGQALTLNGAGLRRKLVFDVYVGALYLPARCGDADAILAADAPWMVIMTFRRDVSQARILQGFIEAFELNSPGELAHLAVELEQLHAALSDVHEGQILALHYVPGSGTTLTAPRGPPATVPGRAFAEAMLRTWLGGRPADHDLKAALLGR